jgi:D-glycero-alpha-D-manno-heptose-7-phosphate kinase
MSADVTVSAPVRVCDVGGWTDTWFAGHGAVCSLAVEPGVTVRGRCVPGGGEVRVLLEDFGSRFTVGSEPPEHRLVGEAVREFGPVAGHDVELSVAAAVPPGASLGTSAAVCVGLIAALDALTGQLRPPSALAAAAHRAESSRTGRQSGVQDQLAAAIGGANLIEVGSYPSSEVRPLAVGAGTWAALDARLVHVAYGSAHDSSAVHDGVIARLVGEGPSSPKLEILRDLARRAATALETGDLESYGSALRSATDAQAVLDPSLVSDAAQQLIDAAERRGASGWKVNGAGGSGGSLSVLLRDPAHRDAFLADARRLGHVPLDLHLAAHGARERS